MKQKVVTKAIIKQSGKVLLLRRHGGRPSIDGLYELPGGRLQIAQQPEDSLQQALHTHTGASAETIQLHDVMTFIDPDDRELQYVFIVFQASLHGAESGLRLSQEYDRYLWKKLSDIQLNEVTQSTQQLLGLAPISFSPREKNEVLMISDAKNTTKITLVAYCDGGSRGNPGPSASGYVLLDSDGTIVAEDGRFLGVTTNHHAEYQAAYNALEHAHRLGAAIVDMRMDSQLVVNQLNGIYKASQPDLLRIYSQIQELSAEFEKVTYTYVARQYNQLADGMVNKTLDQHEGATT